MQLSIIEMDRQETIAAEPGDFLLSVLRNHGYKITAPCGGKGTCRKCEVELVGIGKVLSCQTRVSEDLWQTAGLSLDQPLLIRLAEPVTAQISTDGLLPSIHPDPLVFKGVVRLPQPTLADQRPDDERFCAATGRTLPYRLLPQLPGILRQTDFAPAFYFRSDTGAVIRLAKPDCPEPLGMALDIGTTTLAAYLCNLATGERLASTSMLNPQSSFGADVISRIEQAALGHQQDLQKVICRAIGDLAGRLVDKASRKTGRSLQREDIAHLMIAGNTTMVHLLTGLSADAIARSPFIPVTLQTMTLSAAELNLPLLPNAVCQIMPSISGYVGADITAGILTCGLHRLNEDGGSRSALLLDIGTNGEIVLAGPKGMVACSTAAGPAFEGANIACGMGGVQGAIDKVGISGDDLTYTVIGDNGANQSGENVKVLARGICGSGLVAALAALLDTRLVDETGRITDEPEELAPELGRRVTEINGQTAVILVDADMSATGQAIYLTQKDIREVQNAKAAIAAGILLLVEQAGLKPEQVDHVYIAGGFGNYLDVEHAFRIGLLPEEMHGRTRGVGNTAGMGALYALLVQDALTEAAEAADKVTYYELSADKRFTDLYIEAMMFPEV